MWHTKTFLIIQLKNLNSFLARSVEQKKGRKRQISGGKNLSSLVPQPQTAKRRKTVETDPSAAATSKATTAVTVAPSNRRQRPSTSAETTDDSGSGKDGGEGGGITVWSQN